MYNLGKKKDSNTYEITTQSKKEIIASLLVASHTSLCDCKPLAPF